MKARKLTTKQQMFVAEYLKDLNATQSAIRAGYSEKRASEIGYQLLQKTTVQNAIQKAMKERGQRTEITQDRVLEELALIAFADMRNYVEIDKETGALRLKSFEEMPPDASKAVRKVKEKRRILTSGEGDGKGIIVDIQTEYEHHSKIAALELLGKHLGLFREVDDKAQDTLENRLKDLWRKIEAAQRGEVKLRVAGTSQIIDVSGVRK